VNVTDFDLSPSTEMERRSIQANEFYSAMLSEEEHPWFVSDEATLADVHVGDLAELSERCRQHYGVRLEPDHLRIPFWQLLDYLGHHRT
jgi:hypothetical protein